MYFFCQYGQEYKILILISSKKIILSILQVNYQITLMNLQAYYMHKQRQDLSLILSFSLFIYSTVQYFHVLKTNPLFLHGRNNFSWKKNQSIDILLNVSLFKFGSVFFFSFLNVLYTASNAWGKQLKCSALAWNKSIASVAACASIFVTSWSSLICQPLQL